MKIAKFFCKKNFIVASILITFLSITTTGDAATATWDGDAGDGLWSNPLNWVGDVLPQPGDDIAIDTSGGSLGDIHTDLDVTLQGTMTVGNPSGQLTGTVSLTIDNGMVFTVEGSTRVTRGGTVINEGTIQGSGCSISVILGRFTNNNSVIGISSNVNGITYTNNGTMDNVSIFVLRGTVDNNGIMDNTTLRSPPSDAPTAFASEVNNNSGGLSI